MRPFQAAFVPSRTGRIITVVLHLWAALACLGAFYGIARIIGLLALAAAFLQAWRSQNLRHANAVHQISVGRKGHAALVTGKETAPVAATLCTGSLVSPYALFLKWHLNGRTVWQFILPDMTNRESYRRLAVWAKWGQPQD